MTKRGSSAQPDAQEGKVVSDQRQKGGNEWWPGLVRYVERKIHERRTKRQQEDTIQRASRITATATAWIAFFTLVSLAVSAWTTHLLHNQLIDFEKGSADTHNLSLAAQRPYVWMAPIGASEGGSGQIDFFRPILNQAAHVKVWYYNYGRSPALISGFSGDYKMGENASERLRMTGWQEDSSVLPPTKSDDYDVILGGTSVATKFVPGQLAVLVRIRYKDLSDHLYESDVCFVLDGATADSQVLPSVSQTQPDA